MAKITISGNIADVADSLSKSKKGNTFLRLRVAENRAGSDEATFYTVWVYDGNGQAALATNLKAALASLNKGGVGQRVTIVGDLGNVGIWTPDRGRNKGVPQVSLDVMVHPNGGDVAISPLWGIKFPEAETASQPEQEATQPPFEPDMDESEAPF